MLTAIASMLLSTVTVTPQVDVGRFDPDRFPAAAMRERRLPYEGLMPQVEEILRERRCTIEGQTYRRFDIRIPYLVRLSSDGTATRFVVRDLSCVPLETLAGYIMLDLARIGDFRPTGRSQPSWFAGELRFTVEYR